MRRRHRIALFALAGVVTGILLGIVALNLVTRSDYGMELGRKYAVRWLTQRIRGTLVIERVSGSGLLGGVTLHGFSIYDEKKRPFVITDSATVRYDWRTLMGGEIKLNSIRLWSPKLYIEQLPNDSLWNYQYVFPDTSRGAPRARKLIAFDDARVYNATVIVRRPLEKAFGRDTTRMVIEPVPGGFAHVMRFDQVRADFDRIIWESPIEEGRLFTVRQATGRAFVWEDPVTVTGLQGRVSTRDSVVVLDLSRVEFGGSRASVHGRVIQETGQNYFDILVDGRNLNFRDLRWLYPRMPTEGNAVATLRIQTQRPKGILWHVSNARVTAPGTRMAGSFGIVIGDTVYFTDVNLRAAPLNLELIEGMLPGGLPVDGLLIGTVEVKGPLSSLDTRGDLRLERAGAPAGNSVRWTGNFDARHDLVASNFRADVRQLDLAVLTALRKDLNLKGVVSGRFEADGRVTERLQFAAALQHELAGLSSQFDGSGSFDARSRELDLRLNAERISFEQLAAAYPALRVLHGEARGPINLTGALDHLGVDAQLETDGGRVHIKGLLQQRAGVRRYSGEGDISSFQLDRLFKNLPSANISGKLSFDVTGKSAADATGSIKLALQDALLSGVPFVDVQAATKLNKGVLEVDSLRAQSALGALTAMGALGIAAGHNGEMQLRLHTDSIVPLRTSERGTVTSGRVLVQGTLRGNVSRFDVDAAGTILGGGYGRLGAQRAGVRLVGRALATDSGSVQFTMEGDSIALLGEKLERGTLAVNYQGEISNIRGAGSSKERSYTFAGDLRRDATGNRVSVREMNGGPLRAPWQLLRPFQVSLSRIGVAADSFGLEQPAVGGIIRGGGSLAWARSRADSVTAARQPLDFTLSAQHLDINEYLRWWRAGGAAASGWTDGTMRVSGTAAEPVVNFEATLTDVRAGATEFERIVAGFDYSGRSAVTRFTADQRGRTVVSGGGIVPVDLGFVPVHERKSSDALRFSVRADSLPAASLLGIARALRDVTGSVSGDLHLRGSTRDPTVEGVLTLSNAATTFSASGVRYRDLNGSFRVQDDSMLVIDASGRSGDGNARVQGRLNFSRLSDPRFDTLTVVADAFLAAKRRDAEFTVSGKTLLTGRYRAPRLSGTIQVDRGTLYLDQLYRQYQVVELDRPLLFDVVDTARVAIRTLLPASSSSFLRNLVVSGLTIDVGRESWLRSRNLNVEVTGQLRVNYEGLDTSNVGQLRGAQDLRLTGELAAVRGTYQMEYRPFTRRFAIREGTVEFPGTPGIDPNLNFRALYRARPLQGDPIDIYALVGGTLQNPRIRLSSEVDPPISESDLASYLFFGLPTNALSSTQTRTLGAFNGRFGSVGAVAGLGFNALVTSSYLGYLASGLQSFAQDYGLLDYVSLTNAEILPGAQRSNNALSALFANTQLEVGRYMRENWFLVYSQRLGADAVMPGVRLEWRFHPTFTAQMFAEDRFARSPSLGIEQSATFRKVFGFFLFRDWSY
jgi:autotransporter translocation and assembly factor TamB